MSKKQTRRSISVSGETYDRLKAHAAANGTTGSGVVEDLLRGFFEMPERDQKVIVEAIPRFSRKTAADGFRDLPPPPTKPRPAQVGDPLVGGPRVKEVVLATPVLKEKADWVEKGPADRVQTIRNIAAKVAAEKEAEPKKKEGIPMADLASKIFTF